VRFKVSLGSTDFGGDSTNCDWKRAASLSLSAHRLSPKRGLELAPHGEVLVICLTSGFLSKDSPLAKYVSVNNQRSSLGNHQTYLGFYAFVLGFVVPLSSLSGTLSSPEDWSTGNLLLVGNSFTSVFPGKIHLDSQ